MAADLADSRVQPGAGAPDSLIRPAGPTEHSPAETRPDRTDSGRILDGAAVTRRQPTASDVTEVGAGAV